MALSLQATMSSPIYRDLIDTLNKTTFEAYVRESYRPVIHGYYLAHPEVPMINSVAPEEENNICYTRLPTINIIDLLVTGQYFAFVHAEDVAKVRSFLKTYIDSSKGIKFDKSSEEGREMESFLADCKYALNQLDYKLQDQKDRIPTQKKRLSLRERLLALRGSAL